MPRMNQSRGRIVDAAAAEFAGKGYRGASMEAIAERAGVAKGTLYYNFPAKADLLLTVVREGLAGMRSVCERETESGKQEDQLLISLIRLHADLFLDYREIAEIVFSEVSPGTDSSFAETVSSIRSEYIYFISTILDEGVRTGYIRGIDTGYAAEGILWLIYAACGRFIRTGGTVRGELYRFLGTLIGTGISGGGAA